MSVTPRLDAESGLRHLDIAEARLRRRETREWAREHEEFLVALKVRLAALARTLDWLETA